MRINPPLRTVLFAAPALVLVLCAPAFARKTEDPWTRVQSKNFQLVGNASERDIARVAARLEQFRDAFLRLLSVEHFDSSVPVIVMVFKSDESYRPFEPLYQGQPAGVAGFFQSNPDVDYITITVDRKHVRDANALAFHEYVHLLIRNSFPNAPLWLNEGLAEYYSTFEVVDGNHAIKLGKAIDSRLRTLRERELLPLETLVSVDANSAHYNERQKRALFYAESWALVHYLISGPHRGKLSTFLGLLAKGTSVADSFQQAFNASLARMEDELRQYLLLKQHPEQVISFEKGLDLNASIQSSPLTDAETQFFLGDMLLHTNRLDAAEPYLQRAVELDPGLARAQASLGLLRMRQNRFVDAKKHLELAVAGRCSYLVHYYYAYVLSQEARGSEGSIENYYEAQKTQVMRAHLKSAIALAPNFVEAYRLLAVINLAREENLDETVSLLKQALNLSPRRQQLNLLLAQIYLRRDEFGPARAILEELRANSSDQHTLEQVRSMLERVSAREVLLARVQALNADAFKEVVPTGVIQPCDAPQPGPQLKKLRFEGRQICGVLVQVECDDKGVTLFVEAAEKILKLHNERLAGIRFVTYTAEVKGQVTCGLRSPERPVLVTYRQTADPGKFDGVAVAVEFIPKEWNANH